MACWQNSLIKWWCCRGPNINGILYEQALIMVFMWADISHYSASKFALGICNEHIWVRSARCFVAVVFLWIPTLQKRFFIEVKITVEARAGVAPASQAAMGALLRESDWWQVTEKESKLPQDTEHLFSSDNLIRATPSITNSFASIPPLCLLLLASFSESTVSPSCSHCTWSQVEVQLDTLPIAPTNICLNLIG